jgi:hypothetical protein
MRTLLFLILINTSLAEVYAQLRSEAPILLIDEDFTDGAFDDLGSGE